jgi:hypothetical protein
MCLPRLDKGAGTPPKLLFPKPLNWFEWAAFQAAKVRNVSNVGSHRLLALTSGVLSLTAAPARYFARIPNIPHVPARRTFSLVGRERLRRGKLNPRVAIGPRLSSYELSGFSS